MSVPVSLQNLTLYAAILFGMSARLPSMSFNLQLFSYLIRSIAATQKSLKHRIVVQATSQHITKVQWSCFSPLHFELIVLVSLGGLLLPKAQPCAFGHLLNRPLPAEAYETVWASERRSAKGEDKSLARS